MSPVDMNGFWKMTSNENFDEYMEALDVNIVIRKIASYLIFDKKIVQNGDHFNIKTLTTFRNYHMEFDVGKEFEEDLVGVDDRKCKTRPLFLHWDHVEPFEAALKLQFGTFNPLAPIEVHYTENNPGMFSSKTFIPFQLKKTTVNWEGDKLVCVQKGEKEGRGWTQWVKGDELHVEMRVCGVVCKQVFKKQVLD